jgi:hypothetical protein
MGGFETGVSPTALAERVHPDGAFPPRRKYFLLMLTLIVKNDKTDRKRTAYTSILPSIVYYAS